MEIESSVSETTSSFTYILLAFLPISNSLIDIGRLALIERISSPIIVTTARSQCQAILLFLLSLYLGGDSTPNFRVAAFWLSHLSNWINPFIIICSSTLYLKAIRSSGLSATVPYLSLTPVWVWIFGVLFGNQALDYTRMAGFAPILTGLYILERGKKHGESLGMGQLYMTLVSILWSLTTSLERASLSRYNPIVHLCMTQALISIYGMCLLYSSKNVVDRIEPNLYNLFYTSSSNGKKHREDSGVFILPTIVEGKKDGI
jgi:drug/metabolite transporter (DMT)-like permease